MSKVLLMHMGNKQWSERLLSINTENKKIAESSFKEHGKFN